MTKTLKLDFNERSDATSPLANNDIYGRDLWLYPDRSKLEKQLADLNGLQANQVLCTNGGDEGIMILMRLIKETGKLILPLPAFSQYTWGVESWQLDSQLIAPQDDLSIDINATLEAIKQNSSSITIITRPNNPTGEMISLANVETILKTAKESGGWVFLDEAYIEFSSGFFDKPSESIELLNRYNNLVILRTFSKAFGLAGIRLGYLLGSENLIKGFVDRCMPFNVPQPSLTVAETALAESNREEVKQYCKTIQQNRDTLSRWLNDLGIEVLPSEANFVAIRLPAQQALATKSFLAKNGVLVRSFTDELMQNCLRITIPYELERLQSLLNQALAPKLICLDMDGVLVDTSGSYEATIIATVALLSDIKVTSEDIESLKNAGGYNNDWIVTQKLLSDRGFDFTLDAVTDAFQKIYLGENNDGLVANETPMIDAQLVSQINRKSETRFAIVTGRPRFEANAGTKLVGFEDVDIVSLDDVTEAKPSPEGIEKLQSKYSNFSWMCGDNPDDMQAANASNSLAIGIGSQNAATLYQAGADVVLNNINELEDWLCPIR
ncbi:aminotransferase class I/II-fold pyridoxal phosphate-dependent enzyme [Aliikangiella marina]|uniref:histidinol-phosphate transaminase n=1 Tax=Aliikangiella marina TaxID=1712262 RepID=A0A545T912_9GAMM|nr:aminotransferase class I/II-fold pyridoxal phosphate-dependent enzyme [Aliikangiella marina]TQV73713.1 aminotransferase class I/II-fold pyridoxal phosphate-dependent enzyme [Aliikangiella marina]